MKKRHGTEISYIAEVLIKWIFRHTEDFLKFNIKQEGIIKDINFHVAEFKWRRVVNLQFTIFVY